MESLLATVVSTARPSGWKRSGVCKVEGSCTEPTLNRTPAVAAAHSVAAMRAAPCQGTTFSVAQRSEVHIAEGHRTVVTLQH